jgi:RHS repeat-associated protein
VRLPIAAYCVDNLNARLYDPAITRFMGADTLVPNLYDGQSLNRFAYVEGRPLTFVDPTGHIETVIVTAPKPPSPQPMPIDTGDIDLEIPLFGGQTAEGAAITGTSELETVVITGERNRGRKRPPPSEILQPPPIERAAWNTGTVNPDLVVSRQMAPR